MYRLRFILAFLCAMLFLPLLSQEQKTTADAFSGRKHRILVINSYSTETAQSNNNIMSLMSSLGELGVEAQIVSESLNTRGLYEANEWIDRLRAIYARYITDVTRPDLIILMGQEAWTAHLSMDATEIPERIPVMPCVASRNLIRIPSGQRSLAITVPTSLDYTFLKSRYNIVDGILYDYDVERNLELIKTLYPKTKNIALITDNTYGGLTMLSCVNDAISKHTELNFIKLDGRYHTLYSMADAITHLPDETVILIGTWRVDKDGNYFVKNTIQMLRDMERDLPTFTLSTTGLGYWAIGGYIPEYGDQGERMAEKVRDYLDAVDDGTADGYSKELTLITNRYVFDEAELMRRNFDKMLLPDKFELVNENRSFAGKYFKEMFVIILLALIAIVAVTVIIVTQRRTKRLMKALRRAQYDLAVAKSKQRETKQTKATSLKTISHKIIPPLNAIMQYVDMLASDENMTTKERATVHRIIYQNYQQIQSIADELGKDDETVPKPKE